jgi:hypothetical protein
MMKDFFWHYFARTGSIDAYLLYTGQIEALVPEEMMESENTSVEEPSNIT